jgi:hypothetical protein
MVRVIFISSSLRILRSDTNARSAWVDNGIRDLWLGCKRLWPLVFGIAVIFSTAGLNVNPLMDPHLILCEMAINVCVSLISCCRSLLFRLYDIVAEATPVRLLKVFANLVLSGSTFDVVEIDYVVNPR